MAAQPEATRYLHGRAMTPLSIFGIVAAVAFAIGAGIGSKITSDHEKALQLTQERVAAAAYQARTVELNTIAAQLEQARNDRKTVYRTITQQVEKVVARDVYRNVCLDDDGVRSINSALAGTADTSEPAAAVSATPAAGRQDGR